VLDEKQSQAQSIAGKLEKAIEEGDVILAKSLIKELKMLNKILQIEGINLFIKQMKGRIATSS
jgi:hypothetical protein